MATQKDTDRGTRAEARKISDADHSTSDVANTYRDVPDDEKPDPTSILQEQEVPENWPGANDPAEPTEGEPTEGE